jgi:hypothetical protein
MKTNKILFLVSLLFNFNFLFAQQSSPILDKVTNMLTNLESVEGIANLKRVKESTETTITNLSRNSNTYNQDSIRQLEAIYNELAVNYNSLFDDLKRDLTSLKKVRLNNDKMLRKYTEKIGAINLIYNRFIQLNSNITNTQSRNPLLLIPLATKLFDFAINQIERHQVNQGQIQEAFSLLTGKFVEKYYLKTWNQLWPSYNSASNVAFRINPSQNPQIISPPYFDSLTILEKITLYTVVKETQQMNPVELKELSSVGNVKNFVTTNSYPAGTTLTLGVNTEKFVYFFAQNDNKLELLYPNYSSTMLSSNSINQRVGLNYIQKGDKFILPDAYDIDSNGDKERWIVLVSKSEILNPAKFANEYLTTNNQGNVALSSRITKVNGQNLKLQDYKIVDENTGDQFSLQSLINVYDIVINKK